MDASSELVHSLLPVFMTSVLGASMVTIGVVEGIAEATGSISKIFSGALSDYLGKRKLLAAVGYGLGALTKPLFALAPSLAWVFTARTVDRIGKGIRGAPRDALVGELSPPELRGASYGLRQSLDTVGAFAGPFLALGLMVVSGDAFRLVFWVAVVPAWISVALIVFGVSDGGRAPAAGGARAPIRLREVRDFGADYWSVVAVGAVLTLARFSEAFLILRAGSVGLPVALSPLVLVAMNVAYTGSAYPAGRLSDRIDRRVLLAGGIALLALAEVVLAAARGVVALAIGVLFWGLHMGLTQGILAALVADATPARLRGTAFGVFNLAGGVALLLSSGIAGVLWSAVGPSGTFLAGAVFALLAMVGLGVAGRNSERAR